MKNALPRTGSIYQRCALALLLCVFFLSGCSDKVVVQDLNQKQANEIVAVLSGAAIPAEANKAVGGKSKFEVAVRQADYARAVSILTQFGLPRTEQASFSELIEKKGIVPDSRALEALRLDHALGVQLEEILENNSAISKAKVLVRSHSSQGQTPGVSVVLQKYPQAEIDSAQIAELVRSAIPGISSESIFVNVHDMRKQQELGQELGVYLQDESLVRVPLVPLLFGWHVPAGDYDAIALSLVAFLVVIGIAGGVIGYWFGFLQQGKQSFDSRQLPDPGSAALQLNAPDGPDAREV